MSELENYQTADFAQKCGALLSKIPGVFSANVSEDELGDIAEIHILASTRRNAKQISRDVQSAIAAAFHREVDHRTISIAQIDSAAYAGVDDRRMRQAARLRYAGMNVSMREGRRVYQVRLTREDTPSLRARRPARIPRIKSGAPWPRPPSAPWRAPSRWRGELSLVAVHSADVAGIPIIVLRHRVPRSAGWAAAHRRGALYAQ